MQALLAYFLTLKKKTLMKLEKKKSKMTWKEKIKGRKKELLLNSLLVYPRYTFRSKINFDCKEKKYL